MGFFDFLHDRKMPTPGAVAEGSFGVNPAMNQAMVPESFMPNPGALQQAPTMTEKPGLLSQVGNYLKSGEGLRTIGAALQYGSGDTGAFDRQAQTTVAMRKERKADKLLEQTQQDRAQKNAAFKAAYQGGKFDPAKYAEGVGGSALDPSDIAELTKAFQPKTGVDGGQFYSIGADGEATWGERRAPSYAEENTEARDAEQQRNHDLLMEIARGRLGVARQNASTNSYRAHKAPAGRGGGKAIPALPAGFVVEK